MTAPETSKVSGGIVGLFPELRGLGGIQEAGRQTARALHVIALRKGWTTSFFGLNDAQGFLDFGEGDTKLAFRGFARAKMSFALASLSLARKNPRIVLAAHPNLARPARLMKRIAPSMKVIVMTHGIEVWKPLPLPTRTALLSADLVLAPSIFTAQKLVEMQGIAPEKVRRVAWPLNPDMLAMAEACDRLPFPAGFPTTNRIIVSVGRWSASERYKGADDLIFAIARLHEVFPDLHLVLVGGGDDLPRLKQIAEDRGVSSSVHFLEGLSRLELACCYAHADIFALPSSGEGFGIVFLEAMSFGKPVVGAIAGGITDLVQEGVNGLLVAPHDERGLSLTFERLLRDEKLRSALGRRGAQIVRHMYSYEAFQNELETILAGCLESRNC